MARGVSTVLDVAVCLLLVGAAVATLAAAPPSSTASGPDADDAARTVATATKGVPVGNRTRHATLAAHLASAAVGAATVDGRRALATPYPDAVGNATADAVGDRVFVTASWEPYPNATVNGRITAGERPPESAAVAATTLAVDSGVDPDPTETGSFEALARSLAAVYVEWLFPPERSRAELVDRRTAPRTVARYRAVGDAFGVDVDAELADANAEAANDALVDGLAPRFEAELRRRYETPAAAASAVTAGETRVVVRRWEP